VTAVVRVAKIQAVIFVALVVLLAAFTNIQDYDANFAYVQHVLSMDTTFRHPQVMWRAVTSPAACCVSPADGGWRGRCALRRQRSIARRRQASSV
jgi:predicted small integral membrane protein